MTHVRLHDVHLSIPVRAPLADDRPKRELSGGLFGRLAGRAGGRRVRVDVLQGVSLEVEAGERVGILGRNGSGKSSLLRVMAGIYEPAAGRVDIVGWCSAFLELNAGFDPETSGMENIYYRGYLLGLDKKTIESNIPDILEFADLGDYIYLPVYTYSSGMRSRLAMAVSTCVAPDVLLLDEWVGAGDASFLEKAKARMMGFVMNTNVLVFASHNRAMMRQVCERAIVLEQGRVVYDGPVGDAVHFYEAEVLELPKARKARRAARHAS